MRAAAATLTIAGRNLHTWTNYTGLDPELNAGAQANFTTTDFLTDAAGAVLHRARRALVLRIIRYI